MPGSLGRAAAASRRGGAGADGPGARLAAAVGPERLRALDRLLQWDLVTVTPWGAPVVSPVAARLDPTTATLWTSTATSLGAKLRNLTAHPRASCLLARPGEPVLLLRGTARLHAGDGTATLARLFRMMGGAGGSRAFYARTATDPAWRWLYREYWRRCLIELRAVEGWTAADGTVRVHRLRAWPRPAADPPAGRPAGPVRPAPRPGPAGFHRALGMGGDLDRRGQRLIESGFPCVVAHVPAPGGAPVAWPVAARRADVGWTVPALPGRVAPADGSRARAGLAVHTVDDAFETAEAVGWIGTLEPAVAGGAGDRGPLRFRPRRTYGFVKPPGRAVDALAGLATLARGSVARVVSAGGVPAVSTPDLALAARAAGGTVWDRPPDWPASVWPWVEALFLDRSATVVVLGASLALAPASLRDQLLDALDRAQRHRDAAHGLLLQGGRTLPARRALHLLTGSHPPAAVLAALVRARPGASGRRTWRAWIAGLDADGEAIAARIAAELGGRLPAGHALRPGPGRPGRPGPRPSPAGADGWTGLAAGGRAAAATALALLDRVRPR